jgi:hypothetical protein
VDGKTNHATTPTSRFTKLVAATQQASAIWLATIRQLYHEGVLQPFPTVAKNGHLLMQASGFLNGQRREETPLVSNTRF